MAQECKHGVPEGCICSTCIMGPLEATSQILAERGSRYGPFASHANITQELKAAMYATPGWSRLAADQKEALEMVQHKIGRILNGDPNYDDSWVDIAGYSQLIVDRLQSAGGQE